MTATRKRPIAICTGMIATYPVGGVAWDYGQYALALEALGYDVVYLEDTGLPTYDPRTRQYGSDPGYGVDYLAKALAFLSPALARRWHFRADSGAGFGLPASELRELLAAADVLVNVSGCTLLRDEYMRCRNKLLLDTDPGWNHFVNYPRWERGEGVPGTHGFRGHDRCFTYATRIGRPDCPLPTFGLSWLPTWPPVACDRWAPAPPGRDWTTVMTWNNFRKPVEWQGRTFGTKEVEFPRIEQLPERLPGVPLQLAVGGQEPPTWHWLQLGWRVTSSELVSRTPSDYRDYLQRSRGEISVAKNLYTATRSGWFSCRSVCYLAAGRPVVVQDTGFAELLPTGSGLLAFDDLDGAAAAIAAVEADHARHGAAARELARELFDGEKVLRRLLEQAGVR